MSSWTRFRTSSWTRFRIVFRWFWLSSEWRLRTASSWVYLRIVLVLIVILNLIQNRL